ncbi:MAG: PDZ domain-containing protein [Alphaproteobacteria bacterium]|nr:PDZ domain-containing protein [Alphaproteobacteria bacterium]
MRAMRLLALLITLLAAPAFGQPISPPRAEAGPAASTLVVPFEVYRNKILIAVEINGRALVGVYDSGAERSVLDASAARTLGLETGGGGRAVGFGGDRPLQLARGVEARIAGAAHVFDILPVADLASFTAPFGRRIDMIVGVDAFAESVVEIDVRGARLAFVPRAAFTPPAGAFPLTLRNDGGNLLAAISVDGERVHANVDLGAGDPLTVGPALARRLGLDGGDLPSTVTTGLGGDVEVRLASVKTLSIANAAFDDVPVQVSPVNLPVGEANIGFPLLTRFRLAIDYAERRLWLAPQPDAPMPFVRDYVGVRLARAPDRLRVTHVGAQSPAAAAGLVVGDEILAIDGTRIATWPDTADMTAWMRGPEERAVRLTLGDGREVAVDMRRFY